MVKPPSQSTVSKIVGALVAAVSAWIAQKVISSVWRATTGHVPPEAGGKVSAGPAEVAVAVAITSAVVALARVFAKRGIARYIR